MVFAVAGTTACFAECGTPAEETPKPKTEADATTGTDATETTAEAAPAAQ